MQQTHTLASMVADLEHQKLVKKDYVVKSNLLVMEGGIIHAPTAGKIYTPNEVFHDHIQGKLKIPIQYYRRMRAENIELLDHNVNGWLKQMAGDSKVMLRAFETNEGNIARALLSDRYNRIDNFDVLLTALDAIKKSGAKVEIRQCDVTDKRMYINVVAPDIEIQAPSVLKNYLRSSEVGDGIVSGFCITNSETGYSAFEIKARALILKCQNGLMTSDDRFRRAHLGAKLSEGSINWSEKTRQQNLKLIMSQVQDAIEEFLSKDFLNGMIAKLARAAETPLEHPLDAMENVCAEIGKTISMDEDRKRSILDHFIHGGDTSQAGVFHAVTMEAQEMKPDDRYDAESLAFGLLGRMKQFDKPFSKN